MMFISILRGGGKVNEVAFFVEKDRLFRKKKATAGYLAVAFPL